MFSLNMKNVQSIMTSSVQMHMHMLSRWKHMVNFMIFAYNDLISSTNGPFWGFVAPNVCLHSRTFMFIYFVDCFVLPYNSISAQRSRKYTHDTHYSIDPDGECSRFIPTQRHWYSGCCLLIYSEE